MKKIINNILYVLIKIAGLTCMVQSILCAMGKFQPSVFAISCNYLIVGLFFVFGHFNNFEGENNE
jgi:uncharacterized membrane protein